MSITEQERKNAPYHAGPHGSFPVEDDGGHLKAAWDLAGHSAHPDEIRAHLLAFARKHNIVAKLPKKAQMQLKKATSDAVAALFHLAFHHEEMEGDHAQQTRLVRFAGENGLTHLLPDQAHGMLHTLEVPHKHEGMDEEHTHTVTKAFNPVSQEFLIEKSWSLDGNTFVEGYISPATKDKEKHQFEPEAFQESLPSYFARRAPVSTNHGLVRYPVGHMQKAALVRDGKIFKEFQHPTDPAEFSEFKNTGSGWYGRIVINDAQASDSIQKGNLGGFSWTGNANKWVDLPDGGKKFTNVNHVMESTVAAYPVNGDATMAIAKAYGLEEEPMADSNKLEELLAQILQAQKEPQVETPVVKALDADTLTAALNAFKTEILTAVDNKVIEVKKAVEDAQVPTRGAPAGNRPQASSNPQDEFEANPVEYLVKKATTGEEFTQQEQEVLMGITRAGLIEHMDKDSGGSAPISFRFS